MESFGASPIAFTRRQHLGPQLAEQRLMSSTPGKGIPDAQQPEHRTGAGGARQPAEATPRTPGGTPHGAPKRLGVADKQGNPNPKMTPPAPDREWTRKEQTAEPAIVAPHEASGSPGLADYAEETAKQRREEGSTASPPVQESPQGGAAVPTPGKPPSGGPPSPAAGIDPRTGDTGGRTAQGAGDAAQLAQTSTSGQPNQEGLAAKASSKEDLAKQLGFVSFLECFEASQPASQQPNNDWHLTAVARNHWVIWNARTLEFSRPLPTQERAKQAVNLTE
jgi:hypothetical protein